MKKIIYLVIFLLICPLFLEAQTLYKEAEDFSLDTLEGKSVKLSDYKNKTLLLFFWTSWCPYCRRALVWLNQRYPELKDAGIEVLGINVGESQTKVERFLKDYTLEFKILLDRDGDVAYRYRVLGVPNYVLVDKEGRIKFQANYLPSDYKDKLKD